jgi:hypothetical protein
MKIADRDLDGNKVPPRRLPWAGESRGLLYVEAEIHLNGLDPQNVGDVLLITSQGAAIVSRARLIGASS